MFLLNTAIYFNLQRHSHHSTCTHIQNKPLLGGRFASNIKKLIFNLLTHKKLDNYELRNGRY